MKEYFTVFKIIEVFSISAYLLLVDKKKVEIGMDFFLNLREIF